MTDKETKELTRKLDALAESLAAIKKLVQPRPQEDLCLDGERKVPVRKRPEQLDRIRELVRRA